MGWNVYSTPWNVHSSPWNVRSASRNIKHKQLLAENHISILSVQSDQLAELMAAIWVKLTQQGGNME